MTAFKEYIDIIEGFQINPEEKALAVNFLKSLDKKEKACDSERLSGVMGVLLKELNVYATGALALIAALCPAVFNEKIPPKISKIVEGYNKVIVPPFKISSKNTDEYLDYILAVAGDLRAVLLALAENVYKLRNLEKGDAQADEVLAYAEVVFIPVCHRLGFYRIKSEMEDLVMKHRLPLIYNDIEQKIQKVARERDAVIKRFIAELDKALAQHKLKYRIKGRTKSVASVYAKMQRQEIPFEKVYDLFAVRVITDSKASKEKADCWHVFSVVTNMFKPDLRRLRDWISKPRDNGYESLHITVQQPDKKYVEVQIRSERMDDEAENGLAAHWRYKGGKSDEEVNNYLQKIRKAIEQNVALEDDETYSSDRLSKDLFVFTPTGELKKLRQGATVLDFAFAIHSEVGIRCAGARINGKQAPIKHKLANGDMVEIVTSKKQKPSSDWLNFVNSPRAKSRIKKALDEQKFIEAEEGKEILLRRLRNWKVEFNQDILELLAKHFMKKTITDLYRDIFLEKIDMLSVKKILSGHIIEEEAAEEAGQEANYELKSPAKSTDDALVVDEIENVNYKLAKCCHPVPGDSIFGFVTVARGITIHRNNCPNAMSMKQRYPYRVIPARWRHKEEKANFRIDLYIKGTDREGVLSEVTKIISTYAGLVSVNLKSIGRHFQGKITVQLFDKHQLKKLIKKLSEHRDVIEVYRVGEK